MSLQVGRGWGPPGDAWGQLGGGWGQLGGDWSQLGAPLTRKLAEAHGVHGSVLVHLLPWAAAQSLRSST